MIPPNIARKIDSVTDYVRDHGRVTIHVYEDNQSPGFSYSIGFPVSVEHPEVIVFGLSESLMHTMINELWRMMVADELRLDEGARIGGLLQGFDCIARLITEADAIHEYLRIACRFHQDECGTSIDRAFQIVWPDAATGLFPWDAGCNPDVIARQPMLCNGTLH